MSQTKRKTTIEEHAMQEALAKLAERCVHAEARAKMAEAETLVLKSKVEQLEERAHADDWEKRRLWLAMWTLAGAHVKSLFKFRVEIMREPAEEARRLVYSGKWNYSLSGIDDVKSIEITLPEREPIE